MICLLSLRTVVALLLPAMSRQRAISLSIVAAVPLLAGLLVAGHARADLTWNGSGESGVDPFGHAWLTQNTAFQDVTSWGMPGRAQGTRVYNGNFTIEAIEVTFSGLPDGVTVLEGVPTFRPTMNVTPFGAGDLWTYDLTGDTVRFDPPIPSKTLAPGDSFFLYVPFTDEVVFDDFEFQVTYIGVPEPSSIILASVALAALTALLRRRSRSER